MPCMWSMSLWHLPTASTRSTAPPGGGSGTGSSRTSQVPSPGITTALLIRVIGLLLRCSAGDRSSGGHAAGVHPGQVQSLGLGRRLDLPLTAGAPAPVVVALGDDRLAVVVAARPGGGEELGWLLVERAFLGGACHA